MFEMMTVNCGGKTLENVRNMGINEEDEEDDEGMEVITQTFDPKGLKDCLFFERKNKISKLTELKPEVKFNYSDYVEKIIEAEEENKDKNKKAIPVICLDWLEFNDKKIFLWCIGIIQIVKYFWFYVFL